MKEDDFVNISLRLYHIELYNHMLLVIILSELRRSTPLTFLENTVEIRDIVKPTMITNLYNCHSTISKQSGSMTKTDINDVFGNTLVGTLSSFTFCTLRLSVVTLTWAKALDDNNL